MIDQQAVGVRPRRHLRKRTFLAAAVVVPTVGVMAVVLPASAATAPLRGVASNRCVDVPGASRTNGTQPVLWDCTGAANQSWTDTSSRQLQVYGNKCLDAEGGSTAAGTRAIIWDCTGSANQQWNLNSDGTIRSVQSGLCLDATGGGTANGTAIVLWYCSGGTNQRWTRSSGGGGGGNPSGIPGDAAWVSSGTWATWQNNGYQVANDVWGAGAGSQTIWARSGTNFGVVANHPTGQVKSYPHTGRTLNRRLSSLRSMTSSFNVSVPTSGAYSSDYDIWADDYRYEVMLWMNKYGPVGPIAARYDANGGIPEYRNVSVGGHTWNVYRGSNGSNQVFSFVRTSNTNAGTVDILPILTWIRARGWWGDVLMGESQFGFEISGTNGPTNFNVNSYSLNWS
jgi:hypothetical protein